MFSFMNHKYLRYIHLEPKCHKLLHKIKIKSSSDAVSLSGHHKPLKDLITSGYLTSLVSYSFMCFPDTDIYICIYIYIYIYIY